MSHHHDICDRCGKTHITVERELECLNQNATKGIYYWNCENQRIEMYPHTTNQGG